MQAAVVFIIVIAGFIFYFSQPECTHRGNTCESEETVEETTEPYLYDPPKTEGKETSPFSDLPA